MQKKIPLVQERLTSSCHFKPKLSFPLPFAFLYLFNLGCWIAFLWGEHIFWTVSGCGISRDSMWVLAFFFRGFFAERRPKTQVTDQLQNLSPDITPEFFGQLVFWSLSVFSTAIWGLNTILGGDTFFFLLKSKSFTRK